MKKHKDKASGKLRVQQKLALYEEIRDTPCLFLTLHYLENIYVGAVTKEAEKFNTLLRGH